MSTLIKRLYQNGNEFVPITLSEAVVVNTSNISSLSTLGITTLDRVLRTTLGLVDSATTTTNALNSTVASINEALKNKQDKLTAGTGITIAPDGTISTNFNFELYKVVTSLPTASEQVANTIYLVRTSGNAGNLFTEYLSVKNNTSNKYEWEEIGTISSEVDLTGYVTNETFNAAISSINSTLSNTISATNVTLSDGKTQVVVDYEIPSTLYNYAIQDTTDKIINA